MNRSPWVAAFPMYARPELQPATDALWALMRDNLRAQLIDAPDYLSFPDDLLGFWQRPDLLVSQTCGYPYRHFLKDQVTLVGTPDFGLTDCPPGYYRSAFVVRREDARRQIAAFEHAVFAFNDPHSQSGFAAPMVAAERVGFRFETCRQSGAHVASARMVAEGQADIAALDAVSWRNMQRFDPWAANLRVLDWTEPTPGLPLITAAPALAEKIAAAFAAAVTALSPDHRDLLGLHGIVAIDKALYLAVADPAC